MSTVIGSFYLPSGTPHYPILPSFPLTSGPTCPNTISIITVMSTIRKALEVGTPQTDECSFSYSYSTENRPDPLPGLDIWRIVVVAGRVCECPTRVNINNQVTLCASYPLNLYSVERPSHAPVSRSAGTSVREEWRRHPASILEQRSLAVVQPGPTMQSIQGVLYGVVRLHTNDVICGSMMFAVNNNVNATWMVE